MKEFAEFVVGLFRDLKLPTRLAALICILIVVLVAFLFYEHFTGYFYYARLTRRVELLQALQNLKLAGVDKNPELSPIYQSMVTQLSRDKYDLTPVNRFLWNWPGSPLESDALYKAISSALPWVILIVAALFQEVWSSGRIDRFSILLCAFMLIFAGLAASIGAAIPTILNPWVNYIGVPIVECLFFFVLVRAANKKHPKPSREAPNVRTDSESAVSNGGETKP